MDLIAGLLHRAPHCFKILAQLFDRITVGCQHADEYESHDKKITQ